MSRTLVDTGIGFAKILEKEMHNYKTKRGQLRCRSFERYAAKFHYIQTSKRI